jgi:hypothetical protein
MVGSEIGHERSVGIAETVRKEENALVPMQGNSEGEFRPGDFTGLNGDGGAGPAAGKRHEKKSESAEHGHRLEPAGRQDNRKLAGVDLWL